LHCNIQREAAFIHVQPLSRDIGWAAQGGDSVIDSSDQAVNCRPRVGQERFELALLHTLAQFAEWQSMLVTELLGFGCLVEEAVDMGLLQFILYLCDSNLVYCELGLIVEVGNSLANWAGNAEFDTIKFESAWLAEKVRTTEFDRQMILQVIAMSAYQATHNGAPFALAFLWKMSKATAHLDGPFLHTTALG